MTQCTDAIRISIIVIVVGSAALHIAVMVVPNWWHFDYGTWVQDTSGVLRLNGGLFEVCQFQRKILDVEWVCAGYGEGPEGLLDTREGLHPESNLLSLWRGFTVLALLPSLPAVVLLGFAFRHARQLLLTKIAFGCLLAQSLLMVTAVGISHEYIVQPSCIDCEWRELYYYQWCFYAACTLIGTYMIAALLAMASFFLDRNSPPKAAGEVDSYSTDGYSPHDKARA